MKHLIYKREKSNVCDITKVLDFREEYLMSSIYRLSQAKSQFYAYDIEIIKERDKEWKG